MRVLAVKNRRMHEFMTIIGAVQQKAESEFGSRGTLSSTHDSFHVTQSC